LYNHTLDPGIPYNIEDFENANLAPENEVQAADLIEKLRAVIEETYL
jgi:hypothetical protein